MDQTCPVELAPFLHVCIMSAHECTPAPFEFLTCLWMLTQDQPLIPCRAFGKMARDEMVEFLRDELRHGRELAKADKECMRTKHAAAMASQRVKFLQRIGALKEKQRQRTVALKRKHKEQLQTAKRALRKVQTHHASTDT